MDPATMNMMNEGSFANGNANTTPFNISEIWQFPMNTGGRGLGLRTPQFSHSLEQFSDFASGPNPDGSGHDDDPIGSNGVNRKRRDSEDDESSPKGVVSISNNGGTCNNSNGNGVNNNDGDGKRLKSSVNRDESRDTKAEAENSSEKPTDQSTQPNPEPPKQDYIHVRARRGQATDSHSLAERARREKISERMKILQDLVPGCNKVIGKALVLDEIINYIQSLQRQVEFLSMKLETVNSRDPGLEVFTPKDFGQQTFDTTGMEFGSQATREFSRGSSPEWLHMQVGGGFDRTS